MNYFLWTSVTQCEPEWTPVTTSCVPVWATSCEPVWAVSCEPVWTLPSLQYVADSTYTQRSQVNTTACSRVINYRASDDARGLAPVHRVVAVCLSTGSSYWGSLRGGAHPGTSGRGRLPRGLLQSFWERSQNAVEWGGDFNFWTFSWMFGLPAVDVQEGP